MGHEGSGPFSGFLGGFLYGLSYSDFARPFGLILWSSIFLVALRGIDCSHVITFFTYLAFCMLSGIILVIAMPAQDEVFNENKKDIVYICLFAVFSTIKWAKSLREQQKENEESTVKVGK